MTHRGPEGLPEGGTGKAAGGLLEGFARDWATNGAVLLSLITAVAGLFTGDPVLVAVGLVVGITGMGLPWVALGRRWPITRTWVTVFSVIVADAIALSVMWAMS